MMKVMCGRRLIRTDKHEFLGLTPEATKGRDIVAILYRLSAPVLMRQIQSTSKGENVFVLVGECFIHGMIDGEALGFKEEQRIRN